MNDNAIPSRSVRRIIAALFGDIGPVGETVGSVFGSDRLAYLRRETCLYPEVVTSRSLDALLPELHDVEVVFSTWGMFPLTNAQLDRLPRLRAVFYAAGSVRHFAPPLLKRDITVVSAWAANAVPVAEFCLAQILLANKGAYRNVREYATTKYRADTFIGRGNYGAPVALLGAGAIGSRVIELLRRFRLPVVVFDPFLTYKAAESLGVEKVSLAEAFAVSRVVSNHLADVLETQGLLNGQLFASMPSDATFINTGRGATVNQHDLIRVLRDDRPDLTALLDVTEPEPLPEDSPLWTLPNVQITSHIAGAVGDEVGRLAGTVIEEFNAWRDGQPLRYAVTLPMLETMA